MPPTAPLKFGLRKRILFFFTVSDFHVCMTILCLTRVSTKLIVQKVQKQQRCQNDIQIPKITVCEYSVMMLRNVMRRAGIDDDNYFLVNLRKTNVREVLAIQNLQIQNSVCASLNIVV